MNWKDQIQEHYRKKKIKEQGCARDQIDSFYADAVLPAFEEIKNLLLQFVSSVSIKKYTYKGAFRFEESEMYKSCLLYTSPSPRDQRGSRMPSSA